MKTETSQYPITAQSAILDKIATSRSWKFIDKWWLHMILGTAVVFGLVTKQPTLLFSVLVTGVLCVALAAKGNLFTYIVGIYNSVAYAYIAWGDQLFGEVMLNILFFLPMNIAGIFIWKKHLIKNIVVMRGMSLNWRLIVLATAFTATVVYGFLLGKIPGQNTPYIDALTNVLSIVATILMLARYKEQWILYIFLNIATISMWAIRAINGSHSGWAMIAMWSIFLINACYGYMKWSIGVKNAQA